jgi:hypothetical protein
MLGISGIRDNPYPFSFEEGKTKQKHKPWQVKRMKLSKATNEDTEGDEIIVDRSRIQPVEESIPLSSKIYLTCSKIQMKTTKRTIVRASNAMTKESYNEWQQKLTPKRETK